MKAEDTKEKATVEKLKVVVQGQTDEELKEEQKEQEEDVASVAVVQLASPTEQGVTKVIDSDMLTPQDILSFEMLSLGERLKATQVCPGTPNNSPLESRGTRLNHSLS